MRSAAAIRCDEINDDLDRIEAMTVECYRCDEDNPLAVPRKSCPECRGTGRSPVKFAGIVREIQGAKTEGRGERQDDDLFLEY